MSIDTMSFDVGDHIIQAVTKDELTIFINGDISNPGIDFDVQDLESIIAAAKQYLK